MRLILAIGIALIVLILTAGGWFLYDTWNHGAQIVANGELGAATYSRLIVDLEDTVKMTPLRKELLPIVCMKNVVHREGYLLFKKIQQNGSFTALTMLVDSSDSRKTKLNEMMLAGLGEISFDGCPEDFKKFSDELQFLHRLKFASKDKISEHIHGDNY